MFWAGIPPPNNENSIGSQMPDQKKKRYGIYQAIKVKENHHSKKPPMMRFCGLNFINMVMIVIFKWCRMIDNKARILHK